MDVRFVASDLRRLDEEKGDALALPFFLDERPLRGALGLVDWRLSGLVSRLILRGRASGAEGEAVLVPARPRLPFDKLLLFGVGRLEGLDDPRFAATAERMLRVLSGLHVRAVVLELPGRATNRIGAARAMEIFLALAAGHPDLDQVTLVEDADAQRAMTPVVERAKRLERAEDEDAL